MYKKNYEEHFSSYKSKLNWRKRGLRDFASISTEVSHIINPWRNIPW